jgi:DNA-binding CsgD family transcriptional regulator
LQERHDFSAAKLGSLAVLVRYLGPAVVLSNLLRGHLDRLRCGLAFCDAEGRVDWINRSAERLLAGGPLHLVGSRLLGDTEANTEKLMHELAEAVATTSHTVRYLRFGQDELTLHVAIHAAARPSTVVLTLTSPTRGADIPSDALIHLLGLTPTEARLVAALASGSTLEQYAQEHGVTVGTARVQLKSSQKKTGTRRQSELVRLVWSSAAVQLSSGCTADGDRNLRHAQGREGARRQPGSSP